jgi:hypothetical protein
MLDQATGRLDGKTAAASTARRHRTVLANAMDYAVELGLLDTNLIRALKWTAPKVQPARRVPLRGGFASLDPAAGPKDPAGARKPGTEQGLRNRRRDSRVIVKGV